MTTSDFAKLEVGVGYSTISECELMSKLVPLYDIGEPASCLFWERGVNDTYQLKCDDDTYSLRIYRVGLRTLDAIEFELAALTHLHKRGLSVAHPLAKRDGSFITALQAPEGIRYAIVTSFAHGDKPDYDDLVNAGMYGQAVAQLHNLSDDFVTDHNRPILDLEYLLDTSMDIVRPFVTKGSDEIEYLNKIAEELRQRVIAMDDEKLDVGFCHGDCHGHNVHKHDDVLTHYDFDCCGLGLRVFDLATFKWGSAGHKEFDKHWNAFLTAYKDEREIGEADLSLIDTFVSIRHIWWMSLRCGNVQDFGNAGSGEQFIRWQIGNLKRIAEKKDMST